MNEGLESKGNSRAAAKLEGPSRQSWSWKAVEDETEKFSPPWYGAALSFLIAAWFAWLVARWVAVKEMGEQAAKTAANAW